MGPKHLMTNVNLLHESLMSTGHVQSCALVSRTDCSLVAASVGYSPTPEQLQAVLDAFSNSAEARKSGVVFEAREYRVMRADKNSVYGRAGKKGLVAVRTNLYMVLALYTDSMCPAVCVEACEKLAEYLRLKDK